MEYKFLFSAVVILKKYHIISLLSIKIIIIDWRKMSMIRKVQVDGKTVEIFYKDGVEQTEENAMKGVENIPRDAISKEQMAVFRSNPYDYMEKMNKIVREADDDYLPRPSYCKLPNGEPRITQCNFGIPKKYWNLEMHVYNYDLMKSRFLY